MKVKVFFFASVLVLFSSTAAATDFGKPVSEVADDYRCTEALTLARRAVIETFPNNVSKFEADWILTNKHRLVGIWSSDTGSCEVYDIIELQLPGDRRSPHEILEEDILEHMLRDNAIKKYEAAGNGSFYRLYIE